MPMPEPRIDLVAPIKEKILASPGVYANEAVLRIVAARLEEELSGREDPYALPDDPYREAR